MLYIRNESGTFVPLPNIKGEPGYTPKKGVDYFTEEDIKSLDIATKTYLNELIGNIENELSEV